jgi:hypothetical protein
MSHGLVDIRELAGWGFDDYPYRPELLDENRLSGARHILTSRPQLDQKTVILPLTSGSQQELLSAVGLRSDLAAEMAGLEWKLGLVDLRALFAFQRRLAFSPLHSSPQIPSPSDWRGLLDYVFGAPRAVKCELSRGGAGDIVLQSSNPNLHLRLTEDPVNPLKAHAGGPFLEVARFRERWFLRDGYHRAYALLHEHIFAVPAVMVEAASLSDLGSDAACFFPEDVLLSPHPPRVTDFLEEKLVLTYQRPALRKKIRITIEEFLEPAASAGDHP